MNSESILLAGDVTSLLVLKEDQVSACWSHSFDRKIHSQLDSNFEGFWEERKRNNQRLYSATKFRLDSWKMTEGRLHLNLGLTSYKDYICTNQAPISQRYIDEGLKIHGNGQAFMADPMAVGALLETADNKIVLLERSKWCAEAPGLIDRAGGHPEPQELVKDPSTSDLESQSSESVVSEIFSSILKEIRDEVNIDLKYLSSPLLLGIYRSSSSTAGRPVLEFYIRCSLESDEVVSLYRAGTQSEADESTNILLMDRKEFLGQENMPAKFENLSPCFKIVLPLYRSFLSTSKYC